MKSLNRTLSLVLVLAMVFGLMGVASAATFTDNASVQYTEAVEVMTGIGAINGYTDGSFKPTGTITREEAAKMVTYAILGPTVASKLSVTATGFKDVASDRWSAPYIAYCVSKGIINGMGDGTFAPTANVTGYQLAKMMLCAAGYGAKGEFTGSAWELNVAVAANKYSVFSGANTANYSAPATREEAALYVFNALTSTPTTTYNKLFDKYEPVVYPAGHAKAGQTVEIAEEIYPTLTTTVTNVNGVAGYVWYYKGQPISSFVADGKVLATSADGTSLTDLTTANSTKYIGYTAETAIEYWLNGTKQAQTTLADVITANPTNVRGTVVTFIDTTSPSNGKYDIISITNDTVYTLTGDATTKTTGSVTTVTVPGLAISSVDVKNVSGYEGLKKGDVVLYHNYTAGGVVKHVITKCASFTGMVNGVNVAGSSVVVNMKPYYVSGLTGRTATTDYSAIAAVANCTFYTDLGGQLVAYTASETVNTLENTVYVLETSAASFGAAQAKILKADGTTAVVTVTKVAVYGGTLTDVGAVHDSTPADGTLAKDNFYTFTKNTDGTYNLTVAKTNKVTAGTGSDVNAVVKGTPLLANGTVATNGTVFVYYSATGTKVYTGVANAPTYKINETTDRFATITDSNGLATFVVGVGGDYSTAAAADTKYVFAYAPATTIYPDATTSYYQIKAVVNGEITTIDMKTDLLSAKMGSLEAAIEFENGRASKLATDGSKISATLIAELDASNKDGDSAAYTLGKIDDFTVAGTSLIAKDNGLPLGSFVLNADAKVFKYNGYTATTPIEEITLAELNALTGGEYTLQAVKTSSTDSSLKALFVTVGTNADKSIAFTKAATSTKTFTVTPSTATATATITLGDADRNTVKLADLVIHIDPNASYVATVADTTNGYIAAGDTIVVTHANGTTATYTFAIAT